MEGQRDEQRRETGVKEQREKQEENQTETLLQGEERWRMKTTRERRVETLRLSQD